MKKFILIAATIMILLTGTAKAEEFGLYGVKLGMPKEEVDLLWTYSEIEGYQIPGSAVLNLSAEFDHRNRLYRLSFSVPIPLMDQYPGPNAATAFQKTVQEMYGTVDQAVSIRTGRGAADITVTSKPLLESYNKHIQAQMRINLNQLLKP